MAVAGGGEEVFLLLFSSMSCVGLYACFHLDVLLNWHLSFF